MTSSNDECYVNVLLSVDSFFGEKHLKIIFLKHSLEQLTAPMVKCPKIIFECLCNASSE